jgi:Ca2+-binding RTX toxin-like protein
MSLQITKDLLKPWSPCSEGYKWFIAKFPQGAEFTAVQKALRDDKRFDDARWLTEAVWRNLILQTPALTLDVVADHKAEALEIIAETTALTLEVPTAEELGAGTPTSTSDGGKADSRIGASGHYTQIGASGHSTRIGASGDYTQIGASGHSTRIGASGDYTQIGASGDSTQIGASGDSTRIGASGDYTQIGASGDSTQIGASGDSTQIGASGDSTQIGASGDYTQIGASGDYTQIGASGDYTQINATGKDAVIACAGPNSRARAGANGVMALPWFDKAAERTRIAVGYVGEDLKPDTWYEIKEGKFVEVLA